MLGKIQPSLAGVTNKAVASALGSSIPYASAIRAGRRIPHPRHWQALCRLEYFRYGVISNTTPLPKAPPPDVVP